MAKGGNLGGLTLLFVKRHTPSCKSALESCHLGPNFLTKKQGRWNTGQVVVPCIFGPEDHNSISKFHGSRDSESQGNVSGDHSCSQTHSISHSGSLFQQEHIQPFCSAWAQTQDPESGTHLQSGLPALGMAELGMYMFHHHANFTGKNLRL